MRRYVEGVLKKREIRLGQPRTIGTESDAPAQAPQARIAQQNDTGATLEVVCSCGRRMQLRCDYATAET